MIRPLRPLRWLPLLLLGVQGCDRSAEKVGAAGAVPDGGPAAQPAPSPEPTPPEDLASLDAPPFARVEGERGLRKREAAALQGYTLIAPLRSQSIYLVDMDGKTVHTWETGHLPGGVTRFLPNGHLLRSANLEGNPRFHGGGIGGRIEELDWDGKVVWHYDLTGDERTLHHDFTTMPNGNLLAIAWEYHAPEEIFERGRAQNQVHEEGLWCDVVVEIARQEPTGGKIVWTWRSCDHLVQDQREKGRDFGVIAEMPGRIDINADHRFDAPETEAERKSREEREAMMHGLGYGGGQADGAAGGDVAAVDAPAPAPASPRSSRRTSTTPTGCTPTGSTTSPEQDLIVLSSPHLSEIWVIDHGTTTAEARHFEGWAPRPGRRPPVALGQSPQLRRGRRRLAHALRPAQSHLGARRRARPAVAARVRQRRLATRGRALGGAGADPAFRPGPGLPAGRGLALRPGGAELELQGPRALLLAVHFWG
ncbi:MAG: aryl-sulfate sulfotransferase [Planctomycetes bacterium]|nr:aryl-sulfate sulfotransferase [Planctomycetota bacterium]